MPTAGLNFRAYTDDATARAIRARLDAACALHNAALNILDRTGSGQGLPVVLRPLPLPMKWQGGP
ncbi:MAG: hypothetical protein ACP5G6_01105 [Conexivisphaera sp.]|nr:hypothetical protein [Conexivisphaerales archaeon]